MPARLELRGLTAGELLLTMGLAEHRLDTRPVVLAAPTTDARAILTLIKLNLEASPPAAPVEQFVRGASLGGRMVARAGPWRHDGEWWRAAAGFARQYYELALDYGGVFRDLNSGRWYLDGVYD